MQTMRNVLDIVNDLADSKLAQNPTKLEKLLDASSVPRAFIQLKENRASC